MAGGVLIVEDDAVIARALSTHLRHAGLDVLWAEDGDRGLRKLRFERPDVAVVPECADPRRPAYAIAI